MPTPIGNLEDLSFRALKRLSEAEVFFCEDTRVTKKLLSLLKERFNAAFSENARFISLHSHNENETIDKLDPVLFERPCVYVSDAGMPAVSDPGAKLVMWCKERQIPYEVLPGANAALTAYAASGELSGRFLFYGFLPHKQEARKAELLPLLASPWAIVLYEAPHRIQPLIELLRECAPDRLIEAFKELTKLHEKHLWGDAQTVAEQIRQTNTKGEWVVVVHPGSAVGSRAEAWLIDALSELQAPVKPLSKILARLTDENAGLWYDRLQEKKQQK